MRESNNINYKSESLLKIIGVTALIILIVFYFYLVLNFILI